MSRTSLVLTVLGEDRPGIVEQISDRILAAGGNWEESRMARLAGKFAGLLRVSVEPDRADALKASLMQLHAKGLTVAVEPGSRPEAEDVRALRLELVGNDHPGIIRDISRTLAMHRGNIEELETAVTSAPMSGEALFRARAVVRIPSAVALDTIVRELEALAGELMVDLTLEQPQPGAPA